MIHQWFWMDLGYTAVFDKLYLPTKKSTFTEERTRGDVHGTFFGAWQFHEHLTQRQNLTSLRWSHVKNKLNNNCQIRWSHLSDWKSLERCLLVKMKPIYSYRKTQAWRRCSWRDPWRQKSPAAGKRKLFRNQQASTVVHQTHITQFSGHLNPSEQVISQERAASQVRM